jgi:hypothetical protein
MHHRSRIRCRQGLAAAIIALLALAPAARAQSCRKDSPAHRVALVELYTSEGCSSCPPADRWMSTLVGKSREESVVALGLHVDYWDSLGWRDRFASPVFTHRQNALAKLGNARFVYTPEVFLGMREFRDWHDPSVFESAVRTINTLPAQADITLSVQAGVGARDLAVQAIFYLRPGVVTQQALGFIAIFEDNLSSTVKAGENRGSTLRHDRVVRLLLGPLALPGGTADVRRTVVIPSDWQADYHGVAAFVEDPVVGAILQATSLGLCRAI